MEEADEIHAMVEQVISTKGACAAKLFPRYRDIMHKYQEQPQLLDGYLEGIVVPLSKLLREHAVVQASSDMSTLLAVCRLLHVLVIVRGYKTVVKFFPHEAADLERVLQVGNLTSGCCAGHDTRAGMAQALAFRRPLAVYC